MMALDPGRDVDQQGERRGMGLGKSVGAEALDLPEEAPGELLGVAVGEHALDQLLLELFDEARLSPGPHRPPQLVGLAGREARRHDDQLHRLLLEQRHAEGLLQDLPDGFAREFDRLLAIAPPQVGMDHVPLDRAGTDDRHLDHQVVKSFGFSRGSMLICARDSIWKTPTVSARWIIS